jgi:hypothetical protein
LKSGEKFFTFKTYMVYQDTPSNCIIIFTDKIMSLAIPTKEMVGQYNIALKEMSKYMEELENDEFIDDFEETPKSLNDWLDEMKKESTENKDFDSDVNGMLMN